MSLEPLFDRTAYLLRRKDGTVAASAWMIRAEEDDTEPMDGEEEEEPAKSKKNSDVTLFVASTDRVDRYGDVVEQRWQLANFRKNPVILYEHGVPIIGSGKAKQASGADGRRRLQIEVKWDVGEHNPIATMAAAQHASGMRRAGSVGFRPTKAVNRTELSADDEHYVNPKSVDPWRAGYKYFAPDLLEFSSVAIPANPDALQLQSYLRDAELEDAAIDRTVTELTTKERRRWILDAVQTDAEIRTAIRALLLGAEPPPKPSPAGELSHLFGGV